MRSRSSRSVARRSRITTLVAAPRINAEGTPKANTKFTEARCCVPVLASITATAAGAGMSRSSEYMIRFHRSRCTRPSQVHEMTIRATNALAARPL
jgi:hypothetical protein